MGYQESLVHIQPQDMFDKMIETYRKVKDTGYYQLKGAEPLSVITLKETISNIPKDTKLLWVVGPRCFHNEAGIFDKGAKKFIACTFKIIPVEQIFKGLLDDRLSGINLNISEPTENDFIKRECVAEYARR